MKGIIYLITNSINELCYIGQTIKTINQRWNEHLKDSKRFPNRPLYSAINELGINKFTIEILEECDESLLDSREAYYIQLFDSRKQGYNRNIGGQSRKTYLDKDILQEFNKDKSVIKSAKRLNVCVETVSRCLSRNGINNNIKQIRLVEENKIFQSLKDCAIWLSENNKSKATILNIQNALSRHLIGQRQSYLKMHFEYC